MEIPVQQLMGPVLFLTGSRDVLCVTVAEDSLLICFSSCPPAVMVPLVVFSGLEQSCGFVCAVSSK